MRCLYVDLDGTLLGRGASLFHDGEGKFTLSGAKALQACDRAGLEVVIMSGRRKAQASEDARLIGATSYIYEVGAVVAIDGEELFLSDKLKHSEAGTIFKQISDLGVPELLLERFPGLLEYHAPWHEDREVSHLFRGLVDIDEVAELLATSGFDYLKLIDNGVLHRRSPTLAELDQLRVYHLLPAGASKAAAVTRHMQARGYRPEECMAVGDSREDLATAGVVGRFWLVSNALKRDPTIRSAAAVYGNVSFAESSHGAGVYEAVVQTVMESGAGGSALKGS